MAKKKKSRKTTTGAPGSAGAVRNKRLKRKRPGSGKSTGKVSVTEREIPSNSYGFRWQPGSEMEVVCLFGALLSEIVLRDGKPLQLPPRASRGRGRSSAAGWRQTAAEV